MSQRTRSARRLATLLGNDTGVWVMVRYRRDEDRYVVHWMTGPAAPTQAKLAAFAVAHAAEVPELDVSGLGWCQGEPVQTALKAG